jgi:hypothetical protein
MSWKVSARSGVVVDDSEHEALVLERRELLGGEHVHRNGHQAEQRPNGIHRRPHVQRAVDHASVGETQAIEAMIDPACETALLLVRAAQEARGHHG